MTEQKAPGEPPQLTGVRSKPAQDGSTIANKQKSAESASTGEETPLTEGQEFYRAADILQVNAEQLSQVA